MPGQDQSSNGEDDAFGGYDVEGWQCQSDPDGCECKQTDEEGSQGRGSSRGGRSPLSGEEVSELQEGRKEDVAAISQGREGCDNGVEGLVMSRGSGV